jgi:hypothetical protein
MHSQPAAATLARGMAREMRASTKVNLANPTDWAEGRSEHLSLDISKTIYTLSIKSPKDAYIAFAEKGASNAKMQKHKILH